MKTIEDKIYSSKKAFDVYDQLLKELINYQFQLKDYEKQEEYEACKTVHEKLMNVIAFRSVQISRIIDISSDDLFELFEKNYNEIIKEIK